MGQASTLRGPEEHQDPTRLGCDSPRQHCGLTSCSLWISVCSCRSSLQLRANKWSLRSFTCLTSSAKDTSRVWLFSRSCGRLG